jgi:hypothetical protein
LRFHLLQLYDVENTVRAWKHVLNIWFIYALLF